MLSKVLFGQVTKLVSICLTAVVSKLDKIIPVLVIELLEQPCGPFSFNYSFLKKNTRAKPSS